MKIYKSILILQFFLYILCLQDLHAQDTTAIHKLNSFAQHFKTFTNDYPQEKVYLHFDNTAYYLGETLWFKGYVVTTERNALSQLSKTLYVELITTEGNVLETQKLKIVNGQCNGNFLICDSLFSGFYEVRAYTRYMLNQDKESLFSRVFPVYEKPKKKNGDYFNPRMRERNNSQRIPQFRKEYEQKGKLALSFYPEGGNLVMGMNSKVAFKATGKEGDDAVITGNILNQKGISVAELNSGFEGMGSFEFTPDSGKYTAKIQYNNKDYTFDLPDVLPVGYSMAVENINEEKMDVLIQKNSLTDNEPLGLSVSCRGKLYGFEQVSVGAENALRLTFPKRMLPSGVIQITLFNATGNVLCERLAFVNHHSEMKMSMTQPKSIYEPYEKVNIDFQLNDLKNNPVETTFSVAVRDEATAGINPYNDNLLTNLLLSSELKSYIENPGYYFASDDASRREALDLLMLTQGWSRYVWKQLAGVTPYVVKHPIEKSLVIEGAVLSNFKKKPKQNVDVTMVLMCDSTSQRGTCITDKDGKFNLALEDFNGKSKLVLETKEKGILKENSIILDRAFYPETKIYSFYEKVMPEVFLNNKADKTDTLVSKADTVTKKQQDSEKKVSVIKKTHILPEVTVKTKKPFRKEGEGLRFANVVVDVEKSMDQLIDKNEDQPTSIPELLSKINPFFTYEIVCGPGGCNFICYYKNRLCVLLLNNALPKEDEIFFLTPEEVETVTINETEGVSLAYNPTLNGSEPVIYIYTNKNRQVRKSPIGMRMTKLDGYAKVKEFYSPQYDKVILPNEKDYRRTLYWNPDVKTDKDGKATISFYNNSSCKTMNVSAETVTERGIIGVLNK